LRQVAEAGRVRAVAAEALAETRRKAAVAAQQLTMGVLRSATGEDVGKLIGSRKDLGPNERAYLEAIAGRWDQFSRAVGDTAEARLIAAEGATHVAYLRMMLGEDDAAAAGYRAAAARLEKLTAGDPADPDHRRELGKVYSNLAKLLCGQGRVTEGEAEERRGLAVRAALAAEFPDRARYRDDLAASRLNLGTQLARDGRLAEAEVELRVARGLFAAGAERVGQSKCHNSLGVVLFQTGRLAEAEAEYLLAIAARRSLAGEFPNEPDYAYELAGTRQNLGNVMLVGGRVPDAEREFRAALAATEKLAADFPAVLQYQVSLGGSCCNVANFFERTGRPAEAVPYADRAVAGLTALLAKSPNDATGRAFLRNSYICRAKALAAAGRHAEADADFDRAIARSPAVAQAELRQLKADASPKPDVAPPPREVK